MFSLNMFNFFSGIIELLLLKHVFLLLFKFLKFVCFCVSFLSHIFRIYTYKLLLFYLIDPLCVDLIDVTYAREYFLQCKTIHRRAKATLFLL